MKFENLHKEKSVSLNQVAAGDLFEFERNIFIKLDDKKYYIVSVNNMYLQALTDDIEVTLLSQSTGFC